MRRVPENMIFGRAVEKERGERERERKREREREREREQCKADEKERGRVRDGAYIVNNYDAVKNFALLFDPSV
jgi:hypothetical protein